MRTLPLALAACLMPVMTGAALAALPVRAALPSAVTAATPGTGSAPILSTGLDAGAALEGVTRRRPAKRARGARRDAPVVVGVRR